MTISDERLASALARLSGVLNCTLSAASGQVPEAIEGALFAACTIAQEAVDAANEAPARSAEEDMRKAL